MDLLDILSTYFIECDLNGPPSQVLHLIANEPICGVEELLQMSRRGQGEIGHAAHSGQDDLGNRSLLFERLESPLA